ncbi:MAG: hypothetical protein ACAH95_17590 [Fimbriimonas sp.]
MTSSEPDKLVILTAVEGAPREREVAERRLVENSPDRVTPTRELMGRFPPPRDKAALDVILQVRELHRQSEGHALVSLAERYRRKFGWNPRVEWFRILGLELVHFEGLIGEQRKFLNELYESLAGRLPDDATPTEEPLTYEVLEWAIGANHTNLMEWLWRAGRYEEALVQFPRSLQGLSSPEDDARRIERYLYKASCLYRLQMTSLAAQACRDAAAIDAQAFRKTVTEWTPLMPELQELEIEAR